MKSAPSPGELRAVLDAARAANVVLVGGQALSLWCTNLLAVVPEHLGPVTSHDVDFLGDLRAAETCAGKLGGSVESPPPEDLDVVSAAVVTYRNELGETRILDILHEVLGISRAEVFDRAIDVEVEDIPIRVMHPMHCLFSRFMNIRALHRRDEHALSQARASILCVTAICRQLLDLGDVDEVLSIYEDVFRFARSAKGRDIYRDHEISSFDAVVPFDDLPEKFRKVRFPVMREQIRDRERRSRAAHLRALARPNKP